MLCFYNVQTGIKERKFQDNEIILMMTVNMNRKFENHEHDHLLEMWN